MHQFFGLTVMIATGLWLASRAGRIVTDTFAEASQSMRGGARLTDAVLDQGLLGAGRILLLLISASALGCAIWIAMRMPMLPT